jgi:protein-L-isoaspartate(D-aspartate) O-methyltransferase
MIDQQVRAWDVLDQRVLDALGAVPRECFVPEPFRSLAFADTAIPLPEGQHMLPPKLDGRILQACAIERGARLLDVGSGSGFLAACCAALGARVETIELRPALARLAADNLQAAGCAGVSVATVDVLQFTPRTSYDVVILGAALPAYDARFERWLAPGGRLFAVVGRAAPMSALLVTRVGADEFARDRLFETEIDLLQNAVQPPSFVF